MRKLENEREEVPDISVSVCNGSILEMLLTIELSGPFHTKVIITGPLRPLVATQSLDSISLGITVRTKFVLTHLHTN